MSGDLDTRLARALGGVDAAGADVRERALRGALGALPPPSPRTRWVSGKTLALTVTAATVAGGAFAAVGGLVTDTPASEASLPGRLIVPAGSQGVGVLADGRAWVAMRNGLRIEGMPATALEISPQARFAAAGIGRSLVVLSPTGGRPWTLQTQAPVRQIAWRPDGLEIAYVVGSGPRRELRVVEGDGDRDRRIATIAPVRPYWSADSLGIGAVTPDRRRVMFDAASGARRSKLRAAADAGPSLVAEIQGRDLVVIAPSPKGTTPVVRLPGAGDSGPVTLIRR